MSIIEYNLSMLKKNLKRSAIVGLLTVMGICSGIIPEVSRETFSLNYSISANAQSISDNELEKYARAVLKIEPFRKKAYQQVASLIGKRPPEISCGSTNYNSIDPKFRGQVQRIVSNFCQKSQSIIQSAGLNARRFNQITNQANRDPQLKRRIQNAINSLR